MTNRQNLHNKLEYIATAGGMIPDELEQPIALQFWDEKYRATDKSDKTREDTLTKIAMKMAKFYSDKIGEARNEKHLQKEVNKAITPIVNGWFVPGGRILANYAEPNPDAKATMFNCFVSGTIEDDLENILDKFKEAMVTMKFGGGIGMDFSTIRPRGSLVRGSMTEAKGPIAFMKIWDAGCNTIDAKGKRRGAMMAVLRCDHPDIKDFIRAKREKGVLNGFNLSVAITDDFIHAVANDEDWDLVFDGKVYETVKARELWDLILKSNYEYAEPGVLFIDRINELNNLKYCETIAASNPCLVEGTLVATPNGWKPVETIKEGDTICTVAGTGNVKEVETHNNMEVLEIILSNGMTVKATPAHIFHAMKKGETGVIFDTDTRADQLKVGDYIRIAPVAMPNNTIQPMNGLSVRDSGMVVGAMIGNGCYSKNHNNHADVNVSFGKHDMKFMAKFKELVGAASHYEDRTTYKVSSTNVWHYMESLGFKRSKEPDKDIPLNVVNSNKEFLVGLVDGLISTDGNINMNPSRPAVRLSSTSRKLLKKVQLILLMAGVHGRIYKHHKKGNNRIIEGREVTRNHDMWYLVVMGENIKKLWQFLGGLSHPEKHDKLFKLITEYNLSGETWKAKIVSISKTEGKHKVYDLYEPETDTWITEGIVNRGCGEQPLGPYGACLLGSVNLTAMVDNPFSEKAEFNFERFARAVKAGVLLLDSVIDLSDFPLPEQEKRAKETRRMGIGITGLGSALEMMGIRYGGERAIQLTKEIGQALMDEAYHMSSYLAYQFGTFPDYDPVEYLENSWYVNNCLSEDTIDHIAEYGLRNSHLTSIAPTGTMSLFLGNVSSGIEPIFCSSYTRRVRVGDNEYEPQAVYDYVYYLKKLLVNNGFRDQNILNQSIVTVADLTVDDHLNMMAAIAPFIDSAISKTINIPADYPYEDFVKVYEKAYQFGLKGCTTYRPNEILGSVLTTSDDKEATEKPTEKLEAFGATPIADNAPELLDRPPVVTGNTFKVKWKGNNFYITITRHPSNRLLEVFINSDTDDYQWRVVTGKLLSAIFRREQDISFVIKDLKSIVDPSGGQFIGGQYVPSLLWLIGDIIEQLTDGDESVIIKHEKLTEKKYNPIIDKLPESGMFGRCPECNSYTLKREDGCQSCLSCGYNKCG